MGCNQSNADTNALQSNQKKVNPQIKPIVKPFPAPPQIQPQQNVQQAHVKKQWPLDPNKFNKLPENIKDKYKKAKEKGVFEDQQFPPKQSSLGGPQFQQKIQPFLKTLVWQKPAKFLNANFALFDGIDPQDIKQGQLGNCYCLSTIANYATTPERVVRIFPFYDLKIGFYVVKFYISGKPSHVVLDDYFPCNSTTNTPLFTTPIGNQIWVLLIEKAWAKLMGSYFATQSMSPDLFMEDFTGCPTYGKYFKDIQNSTEELVLCSNYNYLVVLSSTSNQIQGIVSDHAYSLLKVIEHNGTNLYKIRNPWGSFQWNGQYGEQSTLWTPQLIQKCGVQRGDDGIFFLSESQLLYAFEYYSIAIDEDTSRYSYVQFQSQPEENLYFKFKLSKTTNLALRITQPFERLVKDKQYAYSPVVFQIGKIEDNQVAFIDEGGDQCYFGEKSVYVTNQVYNQYQAGDYFVRIKMQWVNPKKYNSAVLSAYCGENVTFERLKQAQGIKYWTKLLGSFMQGKQLNSLDENVSYAMEWMRGQMVCYGAISQNGAQGNYKIKWKFNPSELKNCKLGMNKVSENTIGYAIDQNEGYNVGTLNRILLGEECQAGSAQVQPN